MKRTIEARFPISDIGVMTYFHKKHFLSLSFTLKRKSLLQAVEEAAGSEKLYVVMSKDVKLQDHESCPELQRVGSA